MSQENKDIKRSCIDCAGKGCDEKGGAYPEFCITAKMDPEFLAETMKLYTENKTLYFLRHHIKLLLTSQMEEAYTLFVCVQAVTSCLRQASLRGLLPTV